MKMRVLLKKLGKILENLIVLWKGIQQLGPHYTTLSWIKNERESLTSNLSRLIFTNVPTGPILQKNHPWVLNISRITMVLMSKGIIIFVSEKPKVSWGVPAHHRVGARWSLRSPPTQTILQFCDLYVMVKSQWTWKLAGRCSYYSMRCRARGESFLVRRKQAECVLEVKNK